MLCGWRTLSDLALTCVRQAVSDGSPIDVYIRITRGRSPIPKSAGTSLFRHSLKQSHIRIENIADFEINMGRQIRIWPSEGSTQKDIEIFLLGPAWATLCHQRKILPLHASAIAIEDGVAAFAGHSGTGKSSMAGLMSSLGYKLFADDILPISFNQNCVPGAWPYLRRLKLKHDSISGLGLAAIEPVSEALDGEKYFVLPRCSAKDEWRKLNRLYLLEIDPTESRAVIEELNGADAARALVDQTYHFDFISDSRRFGEHLAFCTQVISKISVYLLRRPSLLGIGREFGSCVRAHLENAHE